MYKHKLKCLFGYHDFKIPHPYFPGILICHHCLRAGYQQTGSYKEWWTWDNPGRMVQGKGHNIYEICQTKNRVHYRNSEGTEMSWSLEALVRSRDEIK